MLAAKATASISDKLEEGESEGFQWPSSMQRLHRRSNSDYQALLNSVKVTSRAAASGQNVASSATKNKNLIEERSVGRNSSNSAAEQERLSDKLYKRKKVRIARPKQKSVNLGSHSQLIK